MEDRLLTKQKYWTAVVLASLFIGGSLVLTQTYSAGVGAYNPWADMNDDGKVNILDCIQLANTFGTSGTPLTKSSVEFDSGWLNITHRQGQNITITHDLNISDWNDEKIILDITGKTTLDGELHRKLGPTPQQGWDKSYGGASEDCAYALVQASDGRYTLAGYTRSYGAGNGDFWWVRTYANGSKLWSRTYGGTAGDEAHAIVHTVDGGYALAGYTYSYGAGSADFWLVKTDSNGNAQWNRTYGGASDDYAYALVQTSDGGYAIAGSTKSFGAGDWDFWLVKTDVNGNIQWSRTYGGTRDDGWWGVTLVQTVDGGYALAGYTYSYGAGFSDFWLVKTDSNGNMQWNRTYGGTSNEQAYALVQTVDGSYALAGYTYSYGGGGGWADFWLVKTDSNGNMQWNMTYGGTLEDKAHALVQTLDGGYALAGDTRDDSWLVKTDSAGNMQWNKTYGGTDWEETYALVQALDGGYTLAGGTDDWTGNWDFWLVTTGKDCGDSGLTCVGLTADTITLFKGTTDLNWNYVRVRILKQKQTP
jgi:hypothetical protein